MKNLTEAYVNTKQKIFIDNLDLVSGDPAEDGGADFGLVSKDIYKQKFYQYLVPIVLVFSRLLQNTGC